MADVPVTPYPSSSGHTSGHAGSEASAERAHVEVADGALAERQAAVLRHVALRVTTGLTVRELRTLTGLHHGQASSTLSVLHRDGRLVRLMERRTRCSVYVLPEYVNGRETAPHGSTRAGREHAFIEDLRDHMALGSNLPNSLIERLMNEHGV